MVLASICGELWRGQAQNGVNLAFQVKFDLEGQGQSPPKTIGTLTKFFCTFCPNLMVLAWTRDDLWHGQAQGWRTHTQTDTHTDRQTQATTIPEGQNWPRVKIVVDSWLLLPKSYNGFKTICMASNFTHNSNPCTSMVYFTFTKLSCWLFRLKKKERYKFMTFMMIQIKIHALFYPILSHHQCWKFPQVRQSEADNLGGGPGTFC